MRNDNNSECILTRVAPTLRDELEKAAREEGRSLSNLTKRVLERWASERRTRSHIRPLQEGAAS